MDVTVNIFGVLSGWLRDSTSGILRGSATVTAPAGAGRGIEIYKNHPQINLNLSLFLSLPLPAPLRLWPRNTIKLKSKYEALRSNLYPNKETMPFKVLSDNPENYISIC